MAEGPTLGASGRLLGTENLQKAIDGFNKGVSDLGQIVRGFNAFKGGYQSGSLSSAMGWSARSDPNAAMRALGGVPGVTPIGGNVRFSGQSTTPAAFGQSPTGAPVPNGGVTTAPWGKSYQPTDSGLLVPQGTPPTGTTTPNGGTPTSRFPWMPETTQGRMALAGAATGYAATKVGQVDRLMGNTSEYSDSMLLDTSLKMGTHGPGITGLAGQMAAQSFGSGGAESAADEAAANAYLSTRTGFMALSPGWQQMKAMGTTATTFDPTMSLSQAVQTTGQFHTASSFTNLKMVGIQSYEDGKKMSPTQIAQQVIDQIDPDKVIQTLPQVEFVVGDPASKLNMTLDAWVAQGVMSQDMANMTRTHIRRILQARTHGVGSQQLERLTRQAGVKGEEGKAARERLKDMGIRDTAAQSKKDREGSERESTAMRLKGWADATIKFNEATERFHEDVNAISDALGLSPLMGLLRAIRQDPLGATLDFVTGGGEHSKPGGKGNSPYAPVAPGDMYPGFTPGGYGGSGVQGMSTLGPGSGGPGLAAKFGITGGHGAAPADLAAATKADTGNAGSKNAGQAGQNAGAQSSGAKKGDQQGGRNQQGGQSLRRPVAGQITRPYGYKDSGYAKGYHTGTDFDGSTGDPIQAAADGDVRVPSFDSDGYGHYVILDHGNGIETWYAHLSRVKVNNGSHAKQGQVIGYMGETGNTTGSHLHFEVRINGRDVDPMNYLGDSMGMTGGSGSSSSNANGDTSESQQAAGSSMAVGFSTSEVENLNAFSGLASMAGYISNAASTESGDSGNRGPGSPNYSGISGGGNVGANVSLGKQMAARMGWTGKQWDALKELWTGESGWSHTADNPDSSAYGIPQALVKYPGRKMPDGYYDPMASSGEGPDFQGKGGDPKVQIAWGLNYIKNNGNFHDPMSALNFWKSHDPHWYAQGAWDIEKDQNATVHKGEMVIPSAQARQIREVLLHSTNNSNQRGRDEQASIVFNEGAIKVSLGAGATTAQGRSVGKQIADAIADDRRIKQLTGAS